MKSLDLQEEDNFNDDSSGASSHRTAILDGVLLKYLETFREDLGQDAKMDSFDRFDDGVILFKITQVITRNLLQNSKNSFISQVDVNSSNKSFLESSPSKNSHNTGSNQDQTSNMLSSTLRRKRRFGQKNSKKGSQAATSKHQLRRTNTMVSEQNIMEMCTFDKLVYIAEPINQVYKDKFCSSNPEEQVFSSQYIAQKLEGYQSEDDRSNSHEETQKTKLIKEILQSIIYFIANDDSLNLQKYKKRLTDFIDFSEQNGVL